jgi:hypothetical protein
MQLEPGRTGRLTLKFIAAMLRTGRSTSNVLIVTNDPKQENVVVSCKFDVRRVPKPSDINAFPRQIRFGRVTPADLLRDTSRVTLKLPADLADASAAIEVTVTDAEVEVRPEPADADTEAERRDTGRLQQYTLVWKKAPPPGRFKAEVLFKIPRKDGVVVPVAIPLDGDVIK